MVSVGPAVYRLSLRVWDPWWCSVSLHMEGALAGESFTISGDGPRGGAFFPKAAGPPGVHVDVDVDVIAHQTKEKKVWVIQVCLSSSRSPEGSQSPESSPKSVP